MGCLRLPQRGDEVARVVYHLQWPDVNKVCLALVGREGLTSSVIHNMADGILGVRSIVVIE